MIPRYSRPEMVAIWSPETKFRIWFEIEAHACDALAELGYSATLAGNAAHALEELAFNADRFDVVFTDVVMPGMTGIELAQEIRRHYAGLPVVLASGYSHLLSENGSYGFELLQKPYSIEQPRVLRRIGRRRKAKRATSPTSPSRARTGPCSAGNGWRRPQNRLCMRRFRRLSRTPA